MTEPIKRYTAYDALMKVESNGKYVLATDYARLEQECDRLREHAAMFVWLRDKCHLFEHYRSMKWRPDAFESEVREAMKRDAALQAKPCAPTK